MFKRLKARKSSVKRSPGLVHDEPPENLYCRPHFLHQAPGETSLDQTVRPVVFPPRNKKLPWSTGYAEVVNAGKSIFNEDQATCKQLILKNRINIDEDWVFLCPSEEPQNQEIMATYWGLFDGHSGPVAAIQASKHLHHCIKEQLEEIFNVISKPSTTSPPIHLMEQTGKENEMSYSREKEICIENVVRGAVEVAFKKCDELIGQYQISDNKTGGCTVLVVLHLQGKLYVASAGDSRAIAVQKNDVIPLSNEFTAVTERQRIQHLAFLKPKLLGEEFSRYEFPRRVKRSDIGKKILYRDYFMSGWGYKTAEEDDLKYPLVHGDGKQTRVMGTIVVTRGLGDHKLKVYDTDLCIKPFLSCIPEVTVFDLGQHEFGQKDALIMATDGLWDVMSNKDVADITEKFLDERKQDPSRYTMLAQYLVLKARGVPHNNDWILEDGSFASLDDISVFVIPLCHLGGTAQPST
ncbi:protein phosphatase 1M-like isoform X1 [Hypanus sabinus]|uniref:protein phosphatase 1M-like isoform X1 n=1 Tax=Hypanus sabinus TaxID=79690 RepID=UPI0028C3C0CB|nr:protein phosphatase 1M-like isoform X1 [Hypanus sabinus]